MARNQEGLVKQLRAARDNLWKKQQKRRREREAATRLQKKLREESKAKEEELKKAREEKAATEKVRDEEMRAKEEELKTVREKAKESLEEERKKSREKDAELARLRRQAPGKIGFVDEGSMQWKAEVKAISEKLIYSPYTDIGGASFRIACKQFMDSGVKWLGIYLCCNDSDQDKGFYAGVVSTLRLAGISPDLGPTEYDVLTSKDTSWGWPTFLEWEEAVDPSKGFVENDCFTMEADVKLICFYKNAVADFSSPDPLFSDVILVVGEKEFHENRIFLAHFSGYFKALFFSGFSEKNKDRVELPDDVEADEFQEMLKMIHPQRKRKEVAEDNVESLLRLGDFFDMQIVLWECIDYLKTSCNPTLAAKLQLTEQYRLPELQYHLLENMETPEHFEEVIKSETFESLSSDMKTTLLQKHFKLRATK